MLKFIKNVTFKEAIFYILIFGIPLVFCVWSYDMYEVPKNVFLKVAVSAIVISYLIDLMRGKKISFFSNKNINYSIGALLFVLILSTLFAVRPSVSFWGSFFRQGGVINFLHYIVLFFIAIQILNNEKNRLIILKLITLSGLIVAIYAILQKVGFDIFSSNITAIFTGRSFSTMGNPTSLGAYLIFPLFSSIALFVSDKDRKIKWAKYLVIFLILLLAIIFTKNRATLLALMVVGSMAGFYHFRRYKKAVIAGVISLVILFSGFVSFYGKDMRSLNSRASMWKSSVSMLKENPITGYGAESFSLLFEKHVNKDFFKYEDYYNLADRPHNEPLEMWIHFGLLGLLFYIFIIIICLKKFFENSDVITHFMSAALLTLFISNFFSFSLTIHYVLVVISLALIFGDKLISRTIKSNIIIKVSAITVALIFVGNIGLNVALAYSNLQLKRAYNSIVTNDFEKGVSSTKHVLKWAPQYKELYSMAFNNLYVISLISQSDTAINTAFTINNKLKKMSGYNLKSLLNEAKILILKKDYIGAEKVFKSIYTLKGDHPLIYEDWGNMYFKQGHFAKAAIVYNQLLDLMPDYWKAPLTSGGKLTYEQRIFWKTHPDFLEVLKNMAFSYEMAGDSKRAEGILRSLE